MRLKKGHLVLILLATLGAGVLVLDGSQRRAVPASSGTALAGEAPGLTAEDRDLNVVQFNIDRGEGPDGETDLLRTAACLERAELAGLNEVGGADQAHALAQELGQAWVFGPSELRWWREHFGNAVLSDLPSTSWKNEPLPYGQAKARRGLVTVTFDWRGRSVTLLVTHIDNGPDRDLQLAFVAERFAALPAPKILLGDLNAGADHPVVAAWGADPTLVATTGPLEGEAPIGIDWIVAAGFTLAEQWRCEMGASDHPAVGARLEASF
ncbi:MAG TPA: endonuclease/exonuclease/phosphatase family protein [Kiloniellales bacterium]|nr:endonuclease/exonuclease/phosphatase family protein [Kiloniellales bacterium]